MNPEINVSQWSALKSSLIAENSNLQPFEVPIEEQAIAIFLDIPDYSYNPLLVQPLIRDLSTLAERCLAYRREASELEILAVKAETDFLQFNKMRELDKQLETNALDQKLPSVENLSRNEGVSKLKQTQSTNLEQSLIEIFDGDAKKALITLENIKARQSLLNQRWGISTDYQEQYHTRHNTDHNAHNYGQRMSRVTRLFSEDMKEIVEKAIACNKGILDIYGISPTLPDLTIPFLDAIVSWIREAMRLIEREAQEEMEIEMAVPLQQPWKQDGKSIVNFKVFEDAFSPNSKSPLIVLTFDLDNLVPGVKRLRMRGVGLSYATQYRNTDAGLDGNVSSDTYAKLRVKMTLPEQLSLDQNTPKNIPIIYLYNVGGYEASPVRMENGPLVFNANPNGTWKIEIEPLAVWKEEEILDIRNGVNAQKIRDLKLHFKFIAKS